MINGDTCAVVPIKNIKKANKLIVAGKKCIEERTVYVELYNEAKTQVGILETKNSKQDKIISNQESIIKNKDTALDNDKAIQSAQSKEIRKQKRIARIGIGVGIAGILAGLIF